MKYDHKKIESKWRREWKKERLYQTPETKKETIDFYQLVEFPYPSGNLHVGHWYAFVVPDIFARAKRMQGYNVMFPIGFDAFGLPAENAAIKHGVNPRKWTYDNIDRMRQQLQTMGAMFDWDREVVTCDSDYYKWTQWLFLQFFKKGLAYQAETLVNWCPSCKTVLANEQVIQGRCERCGTEVEQRKMKQWLLKTRDYAEMLLKGLERLDWPEEIKEAQRNWIGKSAGTLFKFEILNSKSETNSKSQIQNSKLEVEVFTTRPDTLFGATYLVVAPEHKLISDLRSQIANWNEVEKYIKQAAKKTELQRLAEGREKTGVELKGVKAINPATKEKIPVWVADYVLGSVGTGAIMAVPAHDQRDWEFAKKYKLSIREVIRPFPQPLPRPGEGGRRPGEVESAYEGEEVLVNSREFNSMDSTEAREKITKKFGRSKITYRMRDWVVSRQRYWGVPIPIIHCEMCGKAYPVPEKDLPVQLPEIKDYKPKGDGRSPLAKAKDWIKVKCPECGLPAERETDTLDTFVDSSWYFLRYTDPKNQKEFASKNKLKSWLPVDCYSGGAEHTTMHLLYSRFWIKAMHDLKLLDFDEPYILRMNRGIVLGPDGRKMSKRWNNVVDPDEVVQELGADTVRMYLAFIGPYNEVGAYPWDPKGILGIRRFLEKVWGLFQNSKFKSQNAKLQIKIQNLLHKTIKKVTEDIEGFKFNTAISALMVLVNEFRIQNSEYRKQDLEIFLKLLAPFAPHLTEEIWRNILGNKSSIHLEKWPEFDEKLIKEDKVSIVVQINGKVRVTIEALADASEDEVKSRAMADEKVKKHLEGKKIKKIVYVKEKIINFVTS